MASGASPRAKVRAGRWACNRAHFLDTGAFAASCNSWSLLARSWTFFSSIFFCASFWATSRCSFSSG
eukprot:CAMPEP_0177191940 /NCGR_PEP_ID=MMETSP0367-20130122/21629_1 /TAXON_ID=447022 ORGANISM="Scrippsiella hangoei-like, Strain SHHI-4" /NCGR_SAMPLE_ID=MMETSP0367 /ASSEMBLY_ACC=CAM_ASM_000362 /LENGTH=66 /DNA_ID=CAMNT_0018639697 /DNA_START=17 /DNA_END=213 /DNA_ORIENTATION=+